VYNLLKTQKSTMKKIITLFWLIAVTTTLQAQKAQMLFYGVVEEGYERFNFYRMCDVCMCVWMRIRLYVCM
jgi:hypothetical protein